MKCVTTLPFMLLLSFVAFASAAEQEFFAFDNGVGRGKLSPQQQAAVLKELGYHGIGYTVVDQLTERQQAFQEAGLTIYSLYVPCTIGSPIKENDKLVQALPKLENTKTVLWLTVQGKGDDAAAAAVVRSLAEPAAKVGVQVVLYPHYGFRVATTEQAVDIVKLVNLPNVGVTFNLCHELRAGNEARFETILKTAAPYLRLVSINGAEHKGNWDQLIQPLGSGAFDVQQFLQLLKNQGYTGPIGLQCYKVPGDMRENLQTSIAAWRSYQQQLQQAAERP